MLCFIICSLICSTIGFIAFYKKTSDWKISLLGSPTVGCSLGFILGTFVCAAALLAAPTETLSSIQTYQLSPIEENFYVISDSDKFIIRQNGKLTEISRENVKLETSNYPEIIYHYEQKEYKQPWRTLLSPMKAENSITTKSIIIRTPKREILC